MSESNKISIYGKQLTRCKRAIPTPVYFPYGKKKLNKLQYYLLENELFFDRVPKLLQFMLLESMSKKNIMPDERYFILNFMHHLTCIYKAAQNPNTGLNINSNTNFIHLTNKPNQYNLHLFNELTELHHFFKSERENDNIPVRLFTMFVLKAMPNISDMDICHLTDTISFINEFDLAA